VLTSTPSTPSSSTITPQKPASLLTPTVLHFSSPIDPSGADVDHSISPSPPTIRATSSGSVNTQAFVHVQFDDNPECSLERGFVLCKQLFGSGVNPSLVLKE